MRNITREDQYTRLYTSDKNARKSRVFYQQGVGKTELLHANGTVLRTYDNLSCKSAYENVAIQWVDEGTLH